MGEDDVQVLLKPGAVEFQRDVAHDDVAGRGLAWNHPIVVGLGGEGPVAAALQPGGGDDRHTAPVQRRPGDPRLGLERGALQTEEVVPQRFRNLVQAGHGGLATMGEIGGPDDKSGAPGLSNGGMAEEVGVEPKGASIRPLHRI